MKKIKICKMNKVAGEKLLSIWWVLVLVIIAASVVIAVAMYYSAEINVNKVEAEILAGKIINCISDNGYLNKNIDDVFLNCGIDEGIFMDANSFYFKIDVFDGDKNIKNMSAGDSSFLIDCLIEDKISAKHYPRCSIREIRLLDGEKELKIFVIAGSRQKGAKLIKN